MNIPSQDTIDALKGDVGEHGYNYIDHGAPSRSKYKACESYEVALTEVQTIMNASGYTFEAPPEGYLSELHNWIAWGCSYWEGNERKPQSCATVTVW